MTPDARATHLGLSEQSAAVEVVAHWLCSFDNETAKQIMPVAPVLNFNLRREIYEDRALRLVQCLVENGYITPTELGANRWVPQP